MKTIFNEISEKKHLRLHIEPGRIGGRIIEWLRVARGGEETDVGGGTKKKGSFKHPLFMKSGSIWCDY